MLRPASAPVSAIGCTRRKSRQVTFVVLMLHFMEQAVPVIERRPDARKRIVKALEVFLRGTRLRRVHFADSSLAPPTLGYVTHFPRLSIALDGCHTMELAQ